MIFLLTSFGVVCLYFNFYAFDDAHQNKQEIIQEISEIAEEIKTEFSFASFSLFLSKALRDTAKWLLAPYSFGR